MKETKQDTILRAIRLAIHFHGNDVDKSGVLYLFHPFRVMDMARQLGLDEEIQIIGLLHDVVEDTTCALPVIYKAFNKRIGDGVDAMTRRNKKNAVNGVDETYFDFVRRAALNPDARKIKLIDNADNMRPERLVEGLKLSDRYEKAARILWEAEATAEDNHPNSYTEFQSKFDKVVTWV